MSSDKTFTDGYKDKTGEFRAKYISALNYWNGVLDIIVKLNLHDKPDVSFIEELEQELEQLETANSNGLVYMKGKMYTMKDIIALHGEERSDKNNITEFCYILKDTIKYTDDSDLKEVPEMLSPAEFLQALKVAGPSEETKSTEKEDVTRETQSDGGDSNKESNTTTNQKEKENKMTNAEKEVLKETLREGFDEHFDDILAAAERAAKESSDKTTKGVKEEFPSVPRKRKMSTMKKVTIGTVTVAALASAGYAAYKYFFKK